MLGPRIRQQSVDRTFRFERPAGAWRAALLISLALWALIASVATALVG